MSLSKYPEKRDKFQTKVNAKFEGDPNGHYVMAEDVNHLQDAVSAIQSALGEVPQGNRISVGERIGLVEGSSALRVPSFLIYLGIPAKINDSITTLEASGHFSKYDHIVIGNDAQDPNDPDYPLTVEIMDLTKKSRESKFYGYIDCGVNTKNMSISEIQVDIRQWIAMGVSGIYCANFGFEHRVSRERQNQILDSIHEHGLVAILDADNPKEVFTDMFHETMNSNWTKPNIKSGDTFHYNSYALDSSTPNVFVPNVPQEIQKLIDLYSYRVDMGIRIFATPVIQTDVPKKLAQEYYDYAHASALVTSMDGFHPAIEGYGETNNIAPTYDWTPISGNWYSESPRIEYDEQGIICVRELPFGRITLDTKNHTYEFGGIYIPHDMLRIPDNVIDGKIMKDASIEDKKIKSYDGTRLVHAINSIDDPDVLIDAGRIMKFSFDDFDGVVSVDALKANIIDAIHANIGFAVIGEAMIGNLHADKITAGTIDAERITASVIEAINLYAENAEIGHAVIDSAVISDLNADKITAGSIDADRIKGNVIEAINLSAQQADIKDLNADNITAGNIKAERIFSEVVNAINLYAETFVGERAKIDVGVIDDLTATHMRGAVIEAINASIEDAVISKAKISKLDADHIEAAVIDAINANIGKAVIDEAVIEDLSATKITAGTLDADRIIASVMTAINASIENAVIDQAKIGDLNAEKIKAGDIATERLQANSVRAINAYAENMEASDAKIDSAVINELTAGHIEAVVVDAINLYAKNADIDKALIDIALIGELTAENIKTSVIEAINIRGDNALINSAKIGELSASHIDAIVIDAINASIKDAVIDSAKIGDLSAEKIVSGDINTDRLSANVISAINAEIENGTINSAKIGSLDADKITAGDIDAERIAVNVIEAVNANIQNGTIDQAKIGDLNADKITAGNISAERMQAYVVEAVNAYVETADIGQAVIDSAAIGVLDADHMITKVISAVNASIETINGKYAVIDSAKIGSLSAEHIKTAVMDAIHANVGTAVIESAMIGELDADKITTGDIDTDRMTANSIDAVNAYVGTAKINAARIGELKAENIKTEVIEAINATIEEAVIDGAKIGTLEVDSMKAHVIEAINGTFESLVIDKSKIGTLDAEHIQTSVIEAINARIDDAKINNAKIDNLTVGHIEAIVIDAINGRFGSATIDAAKIGVLKADNIQSNTITSNHIATGGLNANVIKSGFIDAERIRFDSLTGDHIQSKTIETKHLKAGEIDGSVIKGDTIHGSKIIAGTLSASNLTAGSITSVEIAAQTIQTRNLASGAVDAKVLRAGSITAEHISTVGLDANLLEVYGTDGQTLIGDGFIKVDGLDVGVVQSDNLAGNGLFQTASSAFGFMRDNPKGEAIIGDQSKVEGSHQLWRIDLTTGEHLAIDTGGTKPVDIAIDYNYQNVYVSLQGEDKVVQIEVAQGEQANRTGVELKTGVGPGKMLYTGGELKDHKHFFVLNTDPKDHNIPDSMTIIDGPPYSIYEDLYVHHMIPLGNTPYDMKMRMVMEHSDMAPGEDQPYPGHTMVTYVTQADQGDIAVLEMSTPSSMDWRVTDTIPISAHMTDGYHGGLDGRFGLGVTVGGDASSQYSDATASGAPEHHHGGYGTSDGSIRTYQPHGLALSQDKNHIYVADYANGHIVVVDVRGKAPYNKLTGTRVTGNYGQREVPEFQQGEAGGGTDSGESMPHEGDNDGDGHGHHAQALSMAVAFGPQLYSADYGIMPLSGGHSHGGPSDTDPIHVPGMEGPITQEQQTTSYVRYRIPVGDSPEKVEVVNGKLFVTLEGSDSVAVIDEADILHEINMDYEYYGPEWNMFVPFRDLPKFSIRKIQVGAKPTEITIGNDKSSIYVTVNGQNQIAQVDVAEEKVVRRFNTGPNPKGTVVSPDGRHIYVVNHGGSGNLSFVYPEGNYIGDAYLGLEGGIEYQGAEHWTPDRSDWVHDPESPSKIQSATTVEFHINEPFLNEGGFTKMSSFGTDNQWSTIEQDIYNVTNYSNGNNIAQAKAEQLKQDASLLRFWPKSEWLEDSVKNIYIHAKTDEFLIRDPNDDRVFYPSNNWVSTPERPSILVGMAGEYEEVSENNYEITYGSSAKIVFKNAIPGDNQVYSSAYFYEEKADGSQYKIHYEMDTEVSPGGLAYTGSHLTFNEDYLPVGAVIRADYTFKHNRWFRNHNGSTLIATENGSSENYYVQFEIDEFVPKFITYDNQQTENFKYWPIEVPSVTNDAYTGLQYSADTNRAKDAIVTSSSQPTKGTLDVIVDGHEEMDDMSGHDDHGHMHVYEGETVELPAGLQYVEVDLGATYMVSKIHVDHSHQRNRVYHKTKTMVSQDGVFWNTIFDSAVSGEYQETHHMAGHGMTHFGKTHTFRPQPVRYIRDYADGYSQYEEVGHFENWTLNTKTGSETVNHWTEIKAFGDWEFEKEFSRNYTSEMISRDPELDFTMFSQGVVTSTAKSEIGTEDKHDITRVVNSDLLSNNYFSSENGGSVTVDLGVVRPVDHIRVYRYFSDARTHKKAKTEISTDGKTWTVIYNSDVDGEYEEVAAGKIIKLSKLTNVRYIRDSAESWSAELQTGTVVTGKDIRWVGIHAYLDYNYDYKYVYQSGGELEGQNMATNGQGVTTTAVPRAYAAIDIPIEFTSWWYMTYIIGPEFGQIDVEMPTTMGGSHSMFQDGPYLNKTAHRHIMSWPPSKNVKEDEGQGIKAGMHRAIARQKTGKVSLDRFRFEDYQYLYMNSIEIPKGTATNFIRYKMEPDVARWYVGRGNQSTEGAYDTPRINIDTGKRDGSSAIKYRMRVKTRLQPKSSREERGVAYVTSSIFETGRLSSHWRMSQMQDSFPGTRIEAWDPNQPHKTGIQNHHLAHGSVRGSKIMPHSIMNHHISPYARIEESRLNLNHPTHRHGRYINVMHRKGFEHSVWFDNEEILNSVDGWGDSGHSHYIARADHTHEHFGHDVHIDGNINGVDFDKFVKDTNDYVANQDNRFSLEERTKLSGISTGANKSEKSAVSGNIIIDGTETIVYRHPTTAGNKHVPSGGAAGQVLEYASSGTAKWNKLSWNNLNDKPLEFAPNRATDSTLGGIKVGSGLAVANDGTLSWTHPTGDGNLHVPATGTSNNKNVLKAGATAGSLVWGKVDTAELTGVITNTQHGNRSGGSLHASVTTSSAGFMQPGHLTKLNNIEESANNYVHPSTHSIEMIVESTGKKILTAAERTKLSGIETKANNYTHPTGDGNLHLPKTSTTSNGKFLKAGSTAGASTWQDIQWSDVNNKPTEFNPVTASASTLGGIKVGDNLTIDANGKLSAQNSYVHPSGDGNNHVPSDGGKQTNKVLKATSTAGRPEWSTVKWAEIEGKPTTFTPSTHTHTIANVTSLQTELNKKANLAGNNVFTGQNTFTFPGSAIQLQPSTTVAANTALIRINNSQGKNLISLGTGPDGEETGRVLINGNLEVTGDTIQKATQDIQGDMNVAGHLDVAGDVFLGDDSSDNTVVNGHLIAKSDVTLGTATNSVTTKGDLVVEGNIINTGKALEVARFPVYGIAGDLQFQTSEVNTYQSIVEHINTFDTAGKSMLSPAHASATRKYKVVVIYSSSGTGTSTFRITGGSNDVIMSEVLPAVNGGVANKARTWMSKEFTTSHITDTVFEVMKNTSGAVAIRYIEVIAVDQY